MKHASTFFFLLLVSVGVLQGQNNEDPLVGIWKNSYGSTLTIIQHNVDGIFAGQYSSSTGATGTYFVIGNSPSISQKNINTPHPLSLSLLWRPSKGATGAPNEEWTSSMTGQILRNKSDEWIMEVFHSLNASTPLSSVEIESAGQYTETLIFKRSSSNIETLYLTKKRLPNKNKLVSARASKQKTPNALTQNFIQGDWIGNPSDEYPYLQVSVVDTDTTSTSSGLLFGHIVREEEDITILGFTTPMFPTGNRQSVALTFMSHDKYGPICYSASGFLYGKDRLELTTYKARSSPYASKYTSTQITSKAIFKRDSKKAAYEAISIPVNKNNFTNNGASEWTADFNVGTTKNYSILKFGLDTGGNFLWVNSTQCTTKSCTDFKHVQFNPSSSSTFRWIDKVPKKINWGPWGNAMGNSGSDYISFSSDYPSAIRYSMELITHFDETPQFDEFLWDGAIAFPANSDQMVKPTSNMLKSLVDNKLIDPDKVCVAFYFNPSDQSGLVTLGNWDSTLVDISSKLVFKYQAYAPVPYLWCSPLASFSIGDTQIASSGLYSFDTGSSALKGDSVRIQHTLLYAKQVFQSTGKWPLMKFKMGLDNQGNLGTLELSAKQYVQLIEEGEHVGSYVPQIQTLSGTPNLYLQGSTMLNYIYSVFWWDAHLNASGTYDLTAREVWLFNKKEGPAIIKKDVATALRHHDNGIHKVIMYPNPTHKIINIDFELTKKSDVTITAHSTQGVLLYTKEYFLPQGKNSLRIENLYSSPFIKRHKTIILTLKYDKKIIRTERIKLY